MKIATTLALMFAAGSALANAPVVNITSPTASGGIIYSGTFPFTQTIAFTINHNDPDGLKKLTQLDVQVNGVGIINGGTSVNPFDNSNQCVSVLTTSPNTCSTQSAYDATVTVPWTVNAIGTYTIVVSTKHKNEWGIDEETVTVAQLNAEFPAPPAVANAYINSNPTLRLLTGKKRGCVISKIAEQHAKASYYGPKGGPYNQALIELDVNSFVYVCN